MSQLQTALSDTTISGYVDVAATFSPGNTGVPYAFGASKAQANGITLNAVDIALDKPMDESPWASGYHVELEMGPNGPQYSSYTSVDGNYSYLRQAYLTLRTPIGNGIDWKVGYFDTIIGYESNSSPLNPNYTHSYGYTIEPTSHTGVIGTYKFSDMVSVTAGVADDSVAPGFDTGMYQPSVLGLVTLTAPDSFGPLKGASVSAGIVNRTWTGGGDSYYVGATIPTPLSALSFGAAFDYLDQHNAVNGIFGVTPNSENDSMWDIAVYGSYKATDKLAFNVRGEYFDNSASGVASAHTASIYPFSAAEELTFTVQYNLWANVLSRAEFRWDHVEHGYPYSSPNTQEANAYMLALNLIYQF